MSAYLASAPVVLRSLQELVKADAALVDMFVEKRVEAARLALAGELAEVENQLKREREGNSTR